MIRVEFSAKGHENILGTHGSTLELTTEDYLTPTGDCIVGVDCSTSLHDMSKQIKRIINDTKTTVELEMRVGSLIEIVTGRGSPGLTYQSRISMVARTSAYVCDRTVMVLADKAAADLDRNFIERISKPDTAIRCELRYII